MEALHRFESYRRELIGGEITFVRLACGSLLLYVDCEPGDGRGLTFWLEPPWHVSNPIGVVVWSRQAEGPDEDGPTTEELDKVSESIYAALLNRKIVTIEVDERSSDLTVTVEGGNCVRTFVSDLDVYFIWHIREKRLAGVCMAHPLDWSSTQGVPDLALRQAHLVKLSGAEWLKIALELSEPPHPETARDLWAVTSRNRLTRLLRASFSAPDVGASRSDRGGGAQHAEVTVDNKTGHVGIYVYWS